MVKISSTGKQHTITIPKDILGILDWDIKFEYVIGKVPEKKILFIGKINKNG